MPKPENDRMISDLKKALEDYTASEPDDFETAFKLAMVSGKVSACIFSGIKIYLRDEKESET